MANRSMQAKVERARSQVVAAGLQEFNKHDYLVAPKLTSEELAKLCEGVKVTKIVPFKCMYAYGARNAWGKRAGACERRLWIGKPPRL